MSGRDSGLTGGSVEARFKTMTWSSSLFSLNSRRSHWIWSIADWAVSVWLTNSAVANFVMVSPTLNSTPGRTFLSNSASSASHWITSSRLIAGVVPESKNASVRLSVFRISCPPITIWFQSIRSRSENCSSWLTNPQSSTSFNLSAARPTTTVVETPPWAPISHSPTRFDIEFLKLGIKGVR